MFIPWCQGIFSHLKLQYSEVGVHKHKQYPEVGVHKQYTGGVHLHYTEVGVHQQYTDMCT